MEPLTGSDDRATMQAWVVAVPVERAASEPVRSGVVNAGPPFDLRATTTAAGSTYAGIVPAVRTRRERWSGLTPRSPTSCAASAACSAS